MRFLSPWRTRPVAAPLPMEVQERFGQITGGRLVEGYGLTEAAPITHDPSRWRAATFE